MNTGHHEAQGERSEFLLLRPLTLELQGHWNRGGSTWEGAVYTPSAAMVDRLMEAQQSGIYVPIESWPI